jgi:osmotically-inducible protein OsmY
MRKMLLTVLVVTLTAGTWAQEITSGGPVVADYGKKITGVDPTTAAIAKEVRHELLMLPWYSLFDDLEYTVNGRTVTLSGSLTSEHSVTKSDAENVVKRIEGVEKVINNIELLPPSPLDTRVRQQAYEALSRTGGLSRYFWEAAPSIHIIVKNQRITLKGFVINEGDKNMAGIAANGIPGVFQVTNELRVVK